MKSNHAREIPNFGDDEKSMEKIKIVIFISGFEKKKKYGDGF